jgi:hypothetical protein
MLIDTYYNTVDTLLLNGKLKSGRTAISYQVIS